MKKIDQAVIAGDLEQGFKYMQKAARGLFDVVINRYLEQQKQKKNSYITVFAGSGNNGGDGMLLAAYLAEEGYPVKCFILGSAAKLKNEAELAYKELEKSNKGELISFINEAEDISFVKEHFDSISNKYGHFFLVDALMGIGAKGEVREPYASLINLVNQNFTRATVIAVDCPSGVDNDSGQIMGPGIRAHNTVTMAYPKLGSFFFPGRANYGLTIVNNLGYSENLVRAQIENEIYFANSVKALMPPRIANGSKYDHGVGALIAGSKGMSGAASLASLAAYRSGLGLLHYLSDEETRKLVASSVFEIVSHSYADDNLKLCEELVEKKVSAFALGPGLGRDNDELVKDLVLKLDSPMILDADALNAFQNDREKLKEHKNDLLICPHHGEYEKLFGDINLEDSPLEKIKTIKANAQDYQMTIVYKGAPTIVADPTGKVFILPYGNSSLATAGTGDVLTGMILSFASQIYTIKKRYADIRFFYENFDINPLTQAAVLAVYIHAKAAEMASKDLSEYSVIASDLIKYIPKSVLQLS